MVWGQGREQKKNKIWKNLFVVETDMYLFKISVINNGLQHLKNRGEEPEGTYSKNKIANFDQGR